MLEHVMPFETLHEPLGLSGWEGFVKRGLGVRIEIVLNEDDLLGARKMNVRSVFEDFGIIDGGAAAVTSMCRKPSSGANSMNRLAVPPRSYS